MYLVIKYINADPLVSGVKIFDIIPAGNYQFKIKKHENYYFSINGKTCLRKNGTVYYSNDYNRTCLFVKIPKLIEDSINSIIHNQNEYIQAEIFSLFPNGLSNFNIFFLVLNTEIDIENELKNGMYISKPRNSYLYYINRKFGILFSEKIKLDYYNTVYIFDDDPLEQLIDQMYFHENMHVDQYCFLKSRLKEINS